MHYRWANICLLAGKEFGLQNGILNNEVTSYFRTEVIEKTLSITSYHGSAMSVVTIRCQRSCYKEQWVVVATEEDLVNHGTTSRNGQAS